jgi:polar amino acid transport system substrate-binding protein
MPTFGHGAVGEPTKAWSGMVVKRMAALVGGLLTLAGLVGCGPSEGRADDSLRACFEIWPPYQNLDDWGTPQGVVLDLTQRVLRTLGRSATYSALPYERCVAMVRGGEMDMVVSSGGEPGLVTADVHKVVWVIGLFMSREQAPLRLSALSELGDLTVGYAQQFQLPAELRGSPYLRFETAPDDRLNFRKLAGGRIDAVATDVPWAFGLSAWDRIGAVYVPPALAVVPQPDAFRPGLEDLRDAYSSALGTMRETGEVDSLYEDALGRSLSEIERTPLLPPRGYGSNAQ